MSYIRTPRALRFVLAVGVVAGAVGQACFAGPSVEGAAPGGSRGAGGAASSSAGGAGGGRDGGGRDGGGRDDGGAGAGGGTGGAGPGGAGSGGGGAACPGTARWLQRYGDAHDQIGLGIGADAQGNMAIAGAFQGSIDLGGTTLSAGSGGTSLYVAKLGPGGAHLWSHAIPAGFDFVLGGAVPFANVAVAPSGDVLLGGAFTGTADFGAGPVVAMSSVGDGFVVAYDPAGNPRWSAHFSDPLPDPTDPTPLRPQVVESVTFDPSGNALALGYRYAGNGGAMFLVKLDPSGNQLWRKDVSSNGTMEATVRTDGLGDVLVAGLAYDAVDFGGGPIQTSPAFPTLFSAKLDPDGNPIWSQGSITIDFGMHPGNAAAVDPAGNLLVAGAGTSIGFDAGCGLAPPEWGVKLLQLDAASGLCRWMWGVSGTGVSLAVDATGRAILATDAADALATCPDTGVELPGPAPCDQALGNVGGNAEVHGLAATSSGRVLMTGAFFGTLGFPGSAELTSAGEKDAFVAMF